VPNTSNTSAFTPEMPDILAPFSFLFFCRHSGMVGQHQTRNLEISDSMLRIVPE
jgi:hypothetical protein